MRVVTGAENMTAQSAPSRTAKRALLLMVVDAALFLGLAAMGRLTADAAYFFPESGDGAEVWLWRATGCLLVAGLLVLGWVIAGPASRASGWRARLCGLGLAAMPASFVLGILSYTPDPAPRDLIVGQIAASVFFIAAVCAVTGLVLSLRRRSTTR